MNNIGKDLDLITRKMNLVDTRKEPVHKSFYELQPRNTTSDKFVYQRNIEPVNSDSITIIPMADLHLGHKNCNVDMIRQHLSFINNTENCYTIFVGDETESATKSSVGMAMYEEDEHIPDQLEIMVDLLHPLAKKGKILGMVPGNHSMRVANLIGVNLTCSIAKMLNVPYLGYQGFISLQVGDTNYEIVVFHGAGHGSLNSSKVASAEKISKVLIADLYLTGHSHIRHKTEDCIYEYRDGALEQRIRHYVTCGSFLEYFGGYAEMKGLPPSPTGSVCIELMSDYKNIIVHI